MSVEARRGNTQERTEAFRSVALEVLASWPVPMRGFLKEVLEWHGIESRQADSVISSLTDFHPAPVLTDRDRRYHLSPKMQKELRWRERVERANAALARLDGTPFARGLERAGIDLPDRLVPFAWVEVGSNPLASSFASIQPPQALPREVRALFSLESWETGSTYDWDKTSWRLKPNPGVSLWHIAWLKTAFDTTQLLAVERSARMSLLSVAWSKAGEAPDIRLRAL